MSQREDKNSETTKDTSHRSLLFSLWKKMTGGKGEKGKKDPAQGEPEAPLPQAQEVPEEDIPIQPEELPYEKQPAPDELMEY